MYHHRFQILLLLPRASRQITKQQRRWRWNGFSPVVCTAKNKKYLIQRMYKEKALKTKFSLF